MSYWSGDSAHVFHVAKAGNDGNGGLAQQYPIALAADAKLTIGSAVTAASNGDRIVIWPGDYDETVDLATAAKSLTLQGTHREKSRIIRTGSGEDGVILYDGTVLENLSISSTYKAAETFGVHSGIGGVSNIVLRDCNILGAYDGIKLAVCNNVFIVGCNVYGYYDGMNLGSNKQVILYRCNVSSNGTYGTDQRARAIYCYSSNNPNELSIINCSLSAFRDDNSSERVAAIELDAFLLTVDIGQVLLTDCLLRAESGSSDSGIVSGIYTGNPTVKVFMNGGSIVTYTTGASELHDLYNVAGELAVNNVRYDRSSEYGTILHGGSEMPTNFGVFDIDAAGRVAVSNQPTLGD